MRYNKQDIRWKALHQKRTAAQFPTLQGAQSSCMPRNLRFIEAIQTIQTVRTIQAYQKTVLAKNACVSPLNHLQERPWWFRSS